MSYYDWLSRMLIPDDIIRNSYQKMMSGLFEKEFICRKPYLVHNDENRAVDGLALREMYEHESGLPCYKKGPCTILEMLGGLAFKCENELMYDPDEGDRTSIWFWDMIENMGLDAMDDWWFDQHDFLEIVSRLNNRTYDSDGYGGPFYIANFEYDMRKIELWYQLNYYVQSKYSW